MNVAAQPISTSGLSDVEFARLAAIAAEFAGLSIPASKKSLVQSRIARRMRQLGLSTCQDYIAFVDSNASETRELISVLTTNVSNFYREKHHFEFLVERVVPKIKEKLDAGQPARIWSAGCSSGQEAYTLAMELLKSMPDLVQKNFRILGTDIDRKILDRAVAGTYSEAEIEAVPRHERDRFFVPAEDRPGSFSVKPELRKLVHFRELNLHGGWPMQASYEAILCRNVVIYFDDETQRALWPRFRDRLAPGGWLMLGHSERIHPLEGTGFASVGVTIYQKTETNTH